MRKIILILAIVVGVIIFMDLSQVGSAFADEAACQACKAQVQAGCERWKTLADKQLCVRHGIGKCANVCRKKSSKGKDD